jgi:hypothetical protein
MLSNPFNRVIFRNKALDYFRFAIGPQNIDPPARTGIFPRHESWSLLGHPTNMRVWRPGSSQLSCHNQTDHYPWRWVDCRALVRVRDVRAVMCRSIGASALRLARGRALHAGCRQFGSLTAHHPPSTKCSMGMTECRRMMDPISRPIPFRVSFTRLYARCRPISAIEISSSRSVTLSWSPIGSRNFGDDEGLLRIGELPTAQAFVNANDLIFADIRMG